MTRYGVCTIYPIFINVINRAFRNKTIIFIFFGTVGQDPGSGEDLGQEAGGGGRGQEGDQGEISRSFKYCCCNF